jgi:hypothetical protein
MKLEFSQQIFKKYWSVKFHENSSIGSQVVSWGQFDGHMKLTVALCNFANTPKKWHEGGVYINTLHIESMLISKK